MPLSQMSLSPIFRTFSFQPLTYQPSHLTMNLGTFLPWATSLSMQNEWQGGQSKVLHTRSISSYCYISRAKVGSDPFLACIHILRWPFNGPNLAFFLLEQLGNAYTTIVASWWRENIATVFDETGSWATYSYCLLVSCSAFRDQFLMCCF